MKISSRSILGAAVSACLLAPLAAPMAAAAGSLATTDLTLTLEPKPAQVADAAKQQTDVTQDQPKYMAAAAEAPNIHGFFNSPFKSAYITPRGLVVENEGLVWQPVAGLVLPLPDFGLKNLDVFGGIWNSVNSHNNDPRVGAWNEMDVFVGFEFDVMPDLHLKADYEAWNFPGATLNKPSTEHVAQISLGYNDEKLWGNSGFSLNPYVNFFWSISGSSTVVLGRGGSTYYFEPGIVPKYVIKGSTPITLTFPTYISIGPEEYWGSGVDALHKADGNLGVFSTGINVGVPLSSLIPVKYGNWHADVGVNYYYLINDALLRAGNLLSGNTERSVFNAYVGVGVGF